MSGNLENGGLSRRGFLKGLAAIATTATASEVLLPKSAEAQTAVESQETKIPLAQEIEAVTREVLSPQMLKVKRELNLDSLSKYHKERDKLYEQLERKFFGNQDRAAGHTAYFERRKPLHQLRDRYREDPEKKDVLANIQTKIAELEGLSNKRDLAAGKFIRVTGEYLRTMETYLESELMENNIREHVEKLPAGSVPTTNLKGEKPDAEKVRAAAIELAEANSALLRFR